MVIWSEAPRPRCQIELIAPSLDEQIGKTAGVRFLDALLREVDWKPWEEYYHQSGPGRPTHHPRVMCAAILYGLIRGMHSTRMLEYATQYNLDFQWLLDGRTIDHSTFAKFRTLHGERIKGLFRQINRKAAQLKRLSLEEVIVDGTRIRADSDRHGGRSAGALQRRLAALEGKIAAALEGLEKAQEQGRSDEAARFEREKDVLEARKKRDQKALAVARQRDVVKKSREGSKTPAVRVPVTDPDAHILPNKEGGFAPNYTPVIAVEAQTGLIVAEQINAGNAESGCMEGLVEEMEGSLGAKPQRMLADEAFGGGHDLQSLKDKGIEAYIPLGKDPQGNPALRACLGQAVSPADWDRLPYRAGKLAKSAFVYKASEDAYYCPMGHALPAYRRQSRRGNQGRKVSKIEYKGAPCQDCPLASRCLSGKARSRAILRDEYEACREEVRDRMNSPAGREIYQRRAPRVEGAFGTIKAAMGMRRFNRRSLQKVRQDWTWTCLAFNLKKMMGWMGDNAEMNSFATLYKLLRQYLAAKLLQWAISARYEVKIAKAA
ncbi:MAG: IS1182 family transposase [Opitutales bacterium]|nr:IS1182 family transposase [Opitutales bacterium]